MSSRVRVVRMEGYVKFITKYISADEVDDAKVVVVDVGAF